MVILKAVLPIAKGEELTHLYSEHNHRDDVSLLVYGCAHQTTPGLLFCSLALLAASATVSRL